MKAHLKYQRPDAKGSVAVSFVHMLRSWSQWYVLHASSTPQVRSVPPPHTPCMHVVPTVQNWPSLQFWPSRAGMMMQSSIAGLHTPTLHESLIEQSVRLPPLPQV